MTSFQSSELTKLPVVENSQLFAQRAHSAGTARAQRTVRPQRALNTCTSWYAYAAMFGSSHSCVHHSSRSGSMCIGWPCFGSHNVSITALVQAQCALVGRVLAATTCQSQLSFRLNVHWLAVFWQPQPVASMLWTKGSLPTQIDPCNTLWGGGGLRGCRSRTARIAHAAPLMCHSPNTSKRSDVVTCGAHVHQGLRMQPNAHPGALCAPRAWQGRHPLWPRLTGMEAR